MVKDAGARYAIIGHSERRQYFAETDDSANRKVQAALAAGLVPILCLGETLAERESGDTFGVVDRQLRAGLQGIAAADAPKVVVAYEPVWAIGTGKTATSGQAQEVHAFLRGILKELWGAGAADAVRILYGGSVKPENIADLMSNADIDGALVGGASLKAGTFAAIVKFT
jgi:triosephosphate isomerase